MQRYDLQAVRLLLDFKSNPNVSVRGISLLSIAASKGFSEIVLMLISAGADLHPYDNPPLLAVLNSGSKMCLSILLFGRTDDVLKEIDGKLLLYYAVTQESSLLPVIAKITKDEIEKLNNENQDAPSFPPKGLSSKQKKEIYKVLELNESLLSIKNIIETVKSVKKVWIPPIKS